MTCVAIATMPLFGGGNSQPRVDVWKTSTCGCCGDWVRHLRVSGFDVRAYDVEEPAFYRGKLGIPDNLGSCHTARVDGYGIEGHLPAQEIHRLLRERPQAIGLAVPAMPIGSPGMDGPQYGQRKDAYDVLLIARDKPPQVYQSYR